MFSRCRSGIIIFVITFFLTLLLLSLTSVTGRQKTEKRLVIVIIFLVILSVILIGIKPILERFTYGGFFDQNRMLFYSYTLNLIADYPLAGTGLGTYVQALNPYLQKDFNVIVSHAHNDYLEMLAEAGLIGGGALILAGFLALGLALRRWLKTADSLARGIGLGALMGVFALFFHSLTDFSLRMPGNAVVWLSLFVLCLKVPLLVEKKTHTST
ncbi:MAG: O-antigen ligase family protein [Candidatus Aminicenantes bacterium]|nr:O-antigen ligase family protein [Candidatus Aminicenantes bacterium]